MQLTNLSYLKAHRHYSTALSEYKPISSRISTGKKLVGQNKDIGSLGQDAGIKSDRTQMQLASQIMSNASNLKDVLIPLTTEHFRSNVLSSTL